MNKTPITPPIPTTASQPAPDKICPIMGAIPVGDPTRAPVIGAKQQAAGVAVQPCVRDKCALWDEVHQQCTFVTKSQNIELLTDVVFKLIKKLDNAN